MLRTLVAAAFGIVLVAGIVLADEFKGKVKSVDADKNTITVTVKVDDKDADKTFTVPADVKIQRKKRGGDLVDVEGGLKGVNEGRDITITTEKKDDKDVVTKVLVGRNPKKEGSKDGKKEGAKEDKKG